MSADADAAAEDSAMLAHLAEASAEERENLRSALADFTRARATGEVRIERGGGHRMGTEPDAPIQAPYPIYPPEVENLRAALSAVRAVYPFDWMAWDGWRNYPDGPSLAAAPVADAVRMVTRIIRGERFYDGAIEDAVENGTLQAAAQRIADALE